MKIEVSIGEVFDKISILEIKKDRIEDENKLRYINHELFILRKELKKEGIMIEEDLYRELYSINVLLWETEDILREKEKNKEYDEAFIHCAEMDSVLNDKRFVIKNKINNHYDSIVKEQKSYKYLQYEVK